MSIHSDFNHAISGYNLLENIVATPTQQSTVTDVWEKTKDTLSQSALSSADLEKDIDSAIPTLPPPQSIQSNIIKEVKSSSGINGVVGVTEEIQASFAKAGVKDLQAMENSMQNVASFLPQGTADQISIKQFAATIRSAIDKLRELIAKAAETTAKADTNLSASKVATSEAKLAGLSLSSTGQTDTNASTSAIKASNGVQHTNVGPSKPWTLDQAIKARQAAVATLTTMGANKAAGTVAGITASVVGGALTGMVMAFVIGMILISIITLNPFALAFVLATTILNVSLLATGGALLSAGVVELAPGKGQGYLEKASNDQLQQQHDQLETSIKGSNSVSVPFSNTAPAAPKPTTNTSKLAPPPSANMIAPPSIDPNKDGQTDIDIGAIQQMIHVLMEMLAKIMIGSQFGLINVQQMQKGLSKLQNPSIPPELQQKIGQIEKTMDFLDIGSPNNVPKVDLKGAMIALTLYNFHQSNGNSTGAQEALNALNKSLYAMAVDPENIVMHQTMNRTFNDAINGNIGSNVGVQNSSA
jgi:hypothetical protein